MKLMMTAYFATKLIWIIHSVSAGIKYSIFIFFITIVDFIFIFLIAITLIILILISVAFFTLLERKKLASFQRRKGTKRGRYY